MFAEGVVAELRTTSYVTFVIAVATVTAVVLTALTVSMIFPIDTTRCRRIRIS